MLFYIGILTGVILHWNPYWCYFKLESLLMLFYIGILTDVILRWNPY